jgi:hypothetical protein
VEYPLDVGGVTPRTICAEVVHTILDLTQSYANLFTLRQTPCFIPYFVFAAGLTRIALRMNERTQTFEGRSMDMYSDLESAPKAEAVSLQQGSSEAGRDIFMSDVESVQSSVTRPGAMTTDHSNRYYMGDTGSFKEEDSLAQAVDQLDQMSFGHGAASQAGWVLRGFKPVDYN